MAAALLQPGSGGGKDGGKDGGGGTRSLLCVPVPGDAGAGEDGTSGGESGTGRAAGVIILANKRRPAASSSSGDGKGHGGAAGGGGDGDDGDGDAAFTEADVACLSSFARDIAHAVHASVARESDQARRTSNFPSAGHR